MNAKTNTPMDVVPPLMALDEADDAAEYRTVSGLAVVSLLVGMAAPLCSLAPLLWAIPLFGVPLAIVALRRVADSDGAMIGRGAAIVGLALCVGSMSAASSRALAVRQLYTREAKVFGLEWLELLQTGETEQAYLRTALRTRRAATPEDERRSEEDPVAYFAEDRVVKAIVQIGANADVRHDRNLEYTAAAGRLYSVKQQYLVTPADHAQGDMPITVWLTLQGTRIAGQAPVRWSVSSYEGGDLPGTDTHGH